MMQSTGPIASCSPKLKAHIPPEPFKKEIVTPLHQHYRQTGASLGNIYLLQSFVKELVAFKDIMGYIFYIIVASLDKRAQLDLSFSRCPLCGNYLPALKIAMAIRGRSFPNLEQKCEMDEINCFVSLVSFLTEVLLYLCREHNVSHQHHYS